MEGWRVNNQQALKLLHRYHDATNTRRLDELDDIFAKDFVNFAAGFEPVKSLAAMKTLIQELLLAFPDWHVTVEDMFAQDNKVVTRWSLAATHISITSSATKSPNGGRAIILPRCSTSLERMRGHSRDAGLPLAAARGGYHLVPWASNVVARPEDMKILVDNVTRIS